MPKVQLSMGVAEINGAKRIKGGDDMQISIRFKGKFAVLSEMLKAMADIEQRHQTKA
jgi:hypothetical protein